MLHQVRRQFSFKMKKTTRGKAINRIEQNDSVARDQQLIQRSNFIRTTALEWSALKKDIEFYRILMFTAHKIDIIV